MKELNHPVRMPITSALVLILAAPVHAAEDTWRYALSVYGWLPNINIEDQQGRMTGISRSDIIENLEPSFLGSFVAGRGRFHAGIDFIYLGLSSKGNDEVISALLSLRKTEISSVLMNPFIGYRVYENERHQINVDLGARYFWQEIDLTFRTPLGDSSGSTSDSVWDAMIGINGRYALTDEWFFRYFGTVGTGQSDLVWSYAGTVGYQFERFDAEAGWRVGGKCTTSSTVTATSNALISRVPTLESRSSFSRSLCDLDATQRVSGGAGHRTQAT